MEGLQGALEVMNIVLDIKIPLGTTFEYTLKHLFLMSFIIGLFFKFALRDRTSSNVKFGKDYRNTRDNPRPIDYNIRVHDDTKYIE